jgi:Ni2+-binding GTPase involved in maturation of urease and hydrogenase
VEDLANYTDAELDAMADRNSKCTPAPQRVLKMGLARTKSLEAITHWVRKKLRDGMDCNLHELTPALICPTYH